MSASSVKKMHKIKNRTIKNKTSKQGKTNKKIKTSCNQQSEIISQFLTFQTQLKLFHWASIRYGQHKASDQLHADLATHIDSFVEKMLGKYKNHADIISIITKSRINITNPATTLEHIIELVKELKDMLIKMKFTNTSKNTDLLNIRDEMLAQLNQFLYLIKLK